MSAKQTQAELNRASSIITKILVTSGSALATGGDFQKHLKDVFTCASSFYNPPDASYAPPSTAKPTNATADNEDNS